jgi:hypothetical protein
MNRLGADARAKLALGELRAETLMWRERIKAFHAAMSETTPRTLTADETPPGLFDGVGVGDLMPEAGR